MSGEVGAGLDRLGDSTALKPVDAEGKEVAAYAGFGDDANKIGTPRRGMTGSTTGRRQLKTVPPTMRIAGTLKNDEETQRLFDKALGQEPADSGVGRWRFRDNALLNTLIDSIRTSGYGSLIFSQAREVDTLSDP